MGISVLEIEKKESIEVFFCYAREDEILLHELVKHLMSLEREGLITLWADVNINAGMEWEKEIQCHLEAARIILLLISPDFMASDYCYSVEMKRAMQRHKEGKALVIPIILHLVDWQGTPFSSLQALPTGANPIVSKSWHHQNEAFYSVAKGLREAIHDLKRIRPSPETQLLTSGEKNADEEEAKGTNAPIATIQAAEALQSREKLQRQRKEEQENTHPTAERDDKVDKTHETRLFVEHLTAQAFIVPANAHFAMSPYQVTNREFQIFLVHSVYWQRGGQCKSEGKVDGNYLAHWEEEVKESPDHPVVNVSWYAAEAYVEWLSKQWNKRVRLPTHEEWEIAARCGRRGEEWWQEEIEKGRVNYRKTEGKIQWVGSFEKNECGFYNILGNAYELCVSKQGDIAGYGGAAHSTLRELTIALPLEPHECREDVGLRIVQDLSD